MASGSVSDWVSGIGSLLAVVVALWFSVLQRRDFQRDRMQAVTGWVEAFGSPASWVLILVNETSQPIYRWKCTIGWDSRGQSQSEVVTSDSAGIIPPGRHEFPWSPGATPAAESRIAIELVFRDITGRDWKRKSNGSIRRASHRTLNRDDSSDA